VRVAERRKSTATSNFGVGRRENHDASGFYARFAKPELSADETVLAPVPLDEPFQLGDARDMAALASGSVALVVTSPPYFAGKQYEEELERDGIPSSYAEYLELLTAVFDECKRTLEPGGRIAVNVANLGRKPYRSLASDVVAILQDRLGLLLRGEVVWRKGEGSSGSCAWGSFRSAGNPVLRDTTERVVIASKGRFSRAKTVEQREQLGLPWQNSLSADEFMAATLDVWEIAPESAKRVRHPAPYPVELPQRLIELYTFTDDLVLDPFMGSGSALVAAARTGRRYVGYDLDPDYVAIARARVAEELAELATRDTSDAPMADAERVHRAIHAKGAILALAERELVEAGFTIEGRDVKVKGAPVRIDRVASDAHGRLWWFDVSGAFTTTRGGLVRVDEVWKAIGQASLLREHGERLVLLSSHLPKPKSEGDVALRGAGRQGSLFDVVALLSDDGRERLARYATGDHGGGPLAGFWTGADLAARAGR
jgi:DNA modification methylase